MDRTKLGDLFWPKGGYREILIGLWVVAIPALGTAIWALATGSWTEVWRTLVSPSELPTWLLLLTSIAAIIGAIGLLFQLKTPAYIRNYRKDAFDYLAWEWSYSAECKIENLTPLCPTHLAEVTFMTMTIAGGCTLIRCPECNEKTWTIYGTTTITQTEALPKINAFIRRGDWKSRSSQFEQIREEIAVATRKLVEEQGLALELARRANQSL